MEIENGDVEEIAETEGEASSDESELDTTLVAEAVDRSRPALTPKTASRRPRSTSARSNTDSVAPLGCS